MRWWRDNIKMFDSAVFAARKEDKLMEDITEVFIEYGIQEATIFESQQMENILSKVPLFLGFFNFTGDRNPYTKTIITKINENKITALVKGIEDITGDLNYYSGLSIMVLDLLFSKGQF